MGKLNFDSVNEIDELKQELATTKKEVVEKDLIIKDQLTIIEEVSNHLLDANKTLEKAIRRLTEREYGIFTNDNDTLLYEKKIRKSLMKSIY